MVDAKERVGIVDIALCLIFSSFSPHAWAKCPTLTAEVHGRIQCSFKPEGLFAAFICSEAG
jgi:hypothetical protein